VGVSKVALKLPLAVVLTVVGEVDVAKLPIVMVTVWVWDVVIPDWVVNTWVLTLATRVVGPKAVRSLLPLADSGTSTWASHRPKESADMPVAKSAPAHCTWMADSLEPKPVP
jgi:fatty acid desaturase